jgi:hypothetical protein
VALDAVPEAAVPARMEEAPSSLPCPLAAPRTLDGPMKQQCEDSEKPIIADGLEEKIK